MSTIQDTIVHITIHLSLPFPTRPLLAYLRILLVHGPEISDGAIAGPEARLPFGLLPWGGDGQQPKDASDARPQVPCWLTLEVRRSILALRYCILPASETPIEQAIQSTLNGKAVAKPQESARA